jgi:hypothetical protein
MSERNCYHDSDFFATYYDEKSDSFKTVEYATTRAWTYTASAKIDAPKELIEEYERRQKEASRKSHERAIQYRAEAANLTVEEYKKLSTAISGSNLESVIKLVKTKKFRSSFRESMANQVREWLANPNPKFPKPLSPKQMQYLY